MSANGRLSLGELAPVAGGITSGGFTGSGMLANPAAAAWNAFAVECRKHGANPTFNGGDSAYRSYERQVYWRNYWCGQGNCANAATPGFSNHGWGLAGDVPPYTQAQMRAYGGPFGWGPCSDAPWESWHRKWCANWHGKDPGPDGHGGGAPPDRYPTLRRGSSKRGAVRRAQRHLRRWNVGIARPKVDGHFGGQTFAAVWQFQLVHGLKPDGVIGKHTWARIRLKDHFLNDERSWLNHLRLTSARIDRDHRRATKREQVRRRRLRRECAKRAHSIVKVSRQHGWKDHHRRARFKVLRHAAAYAY